MNTRSIPPACSTELEARDTSRISSSCRHGRSRWEALTLFTGRSARVSSHGGFARADGNSPTDEYRCYGFENREWRAYRDSIPGRISRAAGRDHECSRQAALRLVQAVAKSRDPLRPVEMPRALCPMCCSSLPKTEANARLLKILKPMP